MARDYKPRPRSGTRRRRKSGGGAPRWVWLLAGLLVGLFVALLVYLKTHHGSPRGAGRTTTPLAVGPGAEDHDTRDVRRHKPIVIPPPPKPKFDFYTILPQMEVVVPDQDITGKPRKGVRQVDQPGTYVLQAGAFRTYKQADQVKAKLAIIGLHAEIQTVTIDGKETWHRVRVGPYTNLDQLNEARARLKEHNIDAVLLKVTADDKGGAG